MPTAVIPAQGPVAVVRDGDATILATEPLEALTADGPAAIEALDRIATGGWWAVALAYDLGRQIERVPDLGRPGPPVPDLLAVRFGRQQVVDDIGTPDLAPSAGPVAWSSSIDRDGYIERIGTIAEHLAAGDCYQVNLTRQLSSDAPIDPLALFGRLHERHPAPHAAFLRTDDIAIVSGSPERFLRVDGRLDGRAVETRPIKGTGTDPAALAGSAKDRAENVMIVDLARNDLGRVCEYGSIEVPHLFEIEEHPGLVHLVSTVRGTLRPDATIRDLIVATFPPASVTGCPKPAVLQIIESLEPVRRGVYCGAVGHIDADRGIVDLNVAIRTFTMAGGRTYFGVGGGIVADSDAAAEWDETELKARRLLALVEDDDG